MRDNQYLLKDVIPNLTISNTAVDLYATYPQLRGQYCTIEILSGSIYINPKTTATTANGNKLEGKSSIDISASTKNVISVISDSSAVIQIWIYG